MATEKQFIAEIRRGAKGANPQVLKGIGDDCAVLRFAQSQGGGKGRARAKDILVTTDFSLEGVHFRRDWHSPESAGHRCLARGLSDIAAMGGHPVAAFLSLALPRDLEESWARRFLHSLIAMGRKNGVTLAGGDTAESPKGILADIVVVGSVPRGGGIQRSTARVGDCIYVSGELGGSAAAVAEMEKKSRAKLISRYYPRHFFPEPRIEVGRLLREKGLATAMIDTSDGLSTDLGHICEESEVGAELQAEAIPRATVGKPQRRVALELALNGGEDYELLFTARAHARIPNRIAGVPITKIGCILPGRKMYLGDATGRRREMKPGGWEHFRG